MAEKNFAVNEPITIVYQAPNKQSGQTVDVKIYLPSGVQDSSFPDFNLTERGNSGTYVGQFTPDDEGEWQAIIALDDGSGQVTKRFSVGEYDVDKVGKEAKGVRDKVDALEVTVDAVDAKVDTVEAKVVVIDGKVDNLSTQVGTLDTPPMVS